MLTIKRVAIADIDTGTRENLIYTVVGSCVAVMLYDPLVKIGGMIHIMLAYSRGDQTQPFKYADTGIPLLIERLIKEGASKRRLLGAKIAGGASMLSEQNPHSQVSANNILAVKHCLTNRGIKIIAEHTGGTTGRRVHFRLDTGQVKVEEDDGTITYL